MDILQSIKNFFLPWIPLSARKFPLTCGHSIGINDTMWNVHVEQPFEQHEDGSFNPKCITISSVCDKCYYDKYQAISFKASGQTIGSMVNL